MSRPERPSLEDRLRAEARALRRAAPPDLAARVAARIDADRASLRDPGPPPARAPRVAAARRALGLAAALVLALAAARLFAGGRPPAEAPAVGSTPESPTGPAADSLTRATAGLLADARALVPDARRGPTLRGELDALRRDTTHAATALARGLPGPVGDLFRLE